MTTSAQTPRKTRSRGRTILFRLIALGVAIAIPLAACEVVLRMLDMGYGHGPVVDHPVFHHWNPTDYDLVVYSLGDEYGGFPMHFNHDGFAMKEELPPKDTPALIFLGDSFTLARQVPDEKRFSTLVGQELGIEGLNFGNGSACPVLSRLELEYFADRISPVAVIYQIFSNDIADENAMRKLAVQDESGRITSVPGEKTSWTVRLARRSYVARVIRSAWLSWKFSQDQKKRAAADWEADAWAPYHSKPIREAYDEGELKNYESSILEMADFCRQKNWPFYVCVIPDRGSLLEKKQDFLTDYIQQFTSDHKIKYIDLLSTFQKYPPKDLFFRLDMHLAQEGHEAMAQAIVEALRRDMPQLSSPPAKKSAGRRLVTQEQNS